MISKKMRNISMVCLSLVLALSLAFGLSSFSVKTADAAATPTVSVDFNSWYAADSSGLSSKPTTISFNNDGFFSAASTQTDYVTYTMASGGEYIKYNKTSSTLSSGDIYGVTTNKSSTTDTQLSFTISANSKVKLLLGVDSNGIPSSTYSATLTGNTKGTADQVVVTSDITIAGKTYTPSVSSSKSKLRYFEFDLDKGTTVFTANAALMCGNSGTARKFFIYDVEITPLVTNYTVSFDTDGGSEVAAETVEEGKTLTDAPTAPTKTGYNFLGWSTDGSTVIDITTVPINSDTTFKAVWELDANFVKPSITEYDAVSNVEIDFGTAIDKIELPTVVTSGEYSLPVTWKWDKDYDATKLQNYTLTGNVTVDANVYDVTAAAPTMQVIVKEIAVESQVLEGTYYTFDNANVLGLPTTIPVSGVDFEISWNAYVADSAAITGSLVAKTGYDVSNATVTANVEKIISSKSAYFNSADAVNDAVGYSYEGAFEAGNGDHFVGLKISKKSLAFAIAEESEVAFVVSGKNGVSIKFNGETLSNSENDLYIDYKGTLPAGRYVIDATSSGQNAFVCYVSIANSETTEYIVGENNTLPTTAQAKDGYTFIGWTDGNNALKTGSVDANSTNASRKIYTAVYAKAEYLGMSFRKSADLSGVRYGFVTEIVDANGNNLEIDAITSVTYTLTIGEKSNTVSFEGDKLNKGYGVVTSGSDSYTGYTTNLVLTGIDASDNNTNEEDKAADIKIVNADLKVDISVTINGVVITAEGISAKISDVVAGTTLANEIKAIYGYAG